MSTLLYIPWFRLEAWEIPIPVLDLVLPIQPFGVLVATGVLLGAKLAETFAKRQGIHPAVATDFITHMLLVGFISSYVLNAAFYEPDVLLEVIQDPKLLFSRYLGISSYGGFIGGVAGALIWKARRGVPLMRVGDAVAFAFPLGWFFGRMGCFVVHDHPGVVTDFPLAVADYRFGMPPYQVRHDLGFYEVLWSAAVMLLFLLILRYHKARKPGLFVALLPLLYAPMRFPLDSLRASYAEGGDARYLDLTPAQWASIGAFAFGLYLLHLVRSDQVEELPAELGWPPPEPKPSEAESSEAEPGEAEPSEAEPSEGEPSEGEPSEAEPSEAEPSEAEPSEAEPSGIAPGGEDPELGAPSAAPKEA
ncbi:MAG: prolipoprotein diacylglyceryl transferase [Myxococcales bacterium]|nr:prolipoprotein diacylglyceryl transferase [Myxococcales bacterium]